MMLSTTDFPELSGFLEGMYHQDSTSIAPTFAGVIEDFGPRFSAAARGFLEMVRAELRKL